MHVSSARWLAALPGGSNEELDPTFNAIHTAHTAMGITHRHTTHYAAPVEGARLISLSSAGLTQWRSANGEFFALHEDGRLLEPLVLVPVPGALVPGEDGPAFAQLRDGAVRFTVAVRGYLRWRMAP